ncbi:MAG: hypothetical protein LBO72_02380 [Helicobacteraceae bacterium]|jgi:hypothetical protein|nr:hypothetical protein [Helicobacteraceae bacterium]
MINKLFLSVSLFCLPTALFCAVSGDEEYFSQTYPFGTIIYAKSAKDEASKAATAWFNVQNEYDRSFGFGLKRPVLALLGFQNQIANAFAANAPFLETVFYGGGAAEIDYFGASDWTLDLLAHEGAHLYQLSAASDFSSLLHDAFGANQTPILAGVIPLWTYPNELLPTLILEGNAVFNESRLTGEGRLFGGRHKALFLALLKSGKLNARRLINNSRDFPYTEEKYIVGGFFQAWLASIYGADKTNEFFAEHARRWINPLLLNKSFNRHYGASYEALIDRFLSDYLSEANAFCEQEGEMIASSKIYAPLGGDSNAIYIYVSDGKTFSDLIRFDRASRQSKRIDGSFFAGRPFFGDFGYATIASAYAASDRIETGLFDKNRAPIAEFNGEIAQDFKEGKKLYFKTSADFAKAILYENDRRIAPVVSNARYGPDGDIYTIRLKDGARVFYKNETELFGAHTQAVLCDVLPQGSVLFAAPTRYGNGLFLWQNKRVIRLGEADNVLDARFVGGEEFLVTSVTAEGYETRLTKFKAYLDKPIKPKTVEINALKNVEVNLSSEARPYGELRDLSLTNIYPFASYDNEDGFGGRIGAYFSDPLGFNSLVITGGKNENGYGAATYNNRRHLLFWGGGIYGEGGKKNSYERDFGASVHAGYLIAKSSTDQLKITAQKLFDADDKNNEPIIVSLEYDYALNYPLAYKSEYSARIALFGRQSEREDRKERAFKAAIEVGTRLFWQTYLTAGASYAKSDDFWIVAAKNPPYPIDPVNYKLRHMPYGLRADRIAGYYGEISARIDTPIYGLTLPIGLHAIAPLARYERLELGKSRFLIEEKTYAMQFETLLAHSFGVAIEAGAVQNNLNKDDRYYMQIDAKNA